MSITITSSHLSKLEHDIQEIRVRALRDIESKISRAILFEDPIDCIFSDLLKGLIRWFSKTPICEEETVLNIIIVLLSSKYGPGVIDYFGTEKIEREINKIRIILSNSEHEKLVLEISEILQNYEREREATMLERRATRKSSQKVPMPVIRIDLTSLDNALDDVLDTDYVKCWNIPQPLEVNSLILLKDSLKIDRNLPGFKHALKYVHTALRDFPTEYFLQPPYIYKSLLALLNENNANNSSELLSLFTQLTKSLMKRKKYRTLTATYNYVAKDLNPYNQISLQKYCFDLIDLVVKNLKINIGNVAFIVSSLNLINVLIKLLKFVDINKNNRDIFYADFLNEFATLVRYYRTKYEETDYDNNFYRTIYINLISCLIKFNYCGKIAVVAERNDNFDELRLVLFDVTIRVFYPKMYNAVKNIVGPLDANSNVSILFDLENMLKIPIEILKNKKVYNEIELIRNGEMILETINTVKSLNILKLLFNSICNNIDYINNDDNLSEIAENLFISLLTVDMVESKKLIYKEAGDRIKFYFNSFMDGEIGINKCNLNKDANRLFNLGIPVTSRILCEIICFGYKSEEFVIHQNSETILILILRGKTVLGNYWNLLIESVTSTFPLLQCFADPNASLGQAIIDLFDPNFDLNEDEILKGNIRFLFSKNYDVRKIGLMRTFSVLRSHPKCNQFLPNIINVYDTVPNEVCIVKNLYDYKMYEIDCDVSTVNPLLELLKSNDVQPSVRKSTLVQLNLMAGNSVINRYIHDNGGWLIAISCLESALLENHTHEYPDAAIPCIGILAKIALQIPEFRRKISNEPNLYFLILRALFLFHLNISLKLDCAVLLFLFLHSDYVIGARNLTVPFLLKNISIPIHTDFYRKHTNKTSDISKFDLIFINNENISEPNNQILKYFRLIFAYLWFDESFPTFQNGTPEYKTKFMFEPKLKLRSADINLIKTTSNLQNLRNIFQSIENTTNHENFSAAINCLELLILVNSKNSELLDDIDLKKLKFYNILPNTIEDERLFIKILNFISKLLNYTATRYNSLLIKLIQDLKKDESTFALIILNSSNYSIDLFTETCRFLSHAMTHFLTKYNSITTSSSDDDCYFANVASELVNKWFCIASNTFKTFNVTKTEEFEKLQSLLTLFRIITSSKLLEYDPVYNRSFINQLFNYISSTKSLSQSGADFTKHCLFCIGNLIGDSVDIKLKYYRLLSSLASHNDFEIRSCAWGLLDKLAMNIGGAENIIIELAYLPGGIHACCLSTVLDINEVPIVRLMAAGLFSNLISFGGRKGRGLNIKVTPRCTEQHDTINEDPIKLIEEIVQRQKLFVRIRESIKYFNVSEVLVEDVDQPITACEVITGYCIILSNLIDIKEDILERHDLLSTVYDIAVLLSYVPIVPTRSSLDMVVDISRLLSRCFSAKKYPSLLDRISTHDFAIMESLGILLNLKYLCEYPAQYLSNCCVNILLTIRQLITRKPGYENYCRFWQRDNNASIFLDLLIYCVKSYKAFPELWKAALKFLLTVYTASQADSYDFETFVDIFDKVGSSKDNEVSDVLVIDLTGDNEEQNNENLNHAVSCEDEPKNDKKVVTTQISGVFGTELLFKRIIRLFDLLCLKDKPESGVVTWTKEKRLCYLTMQVMLKCSLKLRLFAITSKLMDKIIERLAAIHNGLGMTCADYIRKYGDAKKQPIVSELQELLNLITYWYSNHIFDDEVQIYNLFRNFLNIWPWTTSNSEIQFKYFNCLLILSEKSIPVCRRISSSYTGTTGCLIQKIIQKVTDETIKVKTPSGSSEFLNVSLRLLANCCSCIEGRLQMCKQNVLDNISRLHPAIVKTHKGWNDVLYQWLKFWEIFSRYPEGGALRHIPLMCSLIIKTTITKIRVQALKIIRNMCFINANRSGILSSEDILYIFRYILEQDQQDEKFIVVTCIWKLIANSSKGKSVIKNSSIPNRLRTILKDIVSVEENLEQNEFSNVLAITLNILDE